MSTTPPPDALPRLLDREQLHALLGRRQKAGSFTNWVYRVTRDHGFPRPVVMGGRSVAWREDEVFAWLAARPRSDASRSPRPAPSAPPAAPAAPSPEAA